MLTVCGGSGLDAEFLHRAGARVILSDISEGVLDRRLHGHAGFGLDIELVVADAENLRPFADRSVDIVYVHDGLHHLEHPMDAIGEMARSPVARSRSMRARDRPRDVGRRPYRLGGTARRPGTSSAG